MTNDYSCDQYLSGGQVRNPKLPRNKQGDSVIDSSPWPIGEGIGISLVVGGGFGLGGLLLVGGADLFFPIPNALIYQIPGLIALLVFLFGISVTYVLPSIFKPIELGTAARKQAYLKYHELSREHQLEVKNAYEYYMAVDTGRDPNGAQHTSEYYKARKLWTDTYAELQRREKLLKIEAQPHPRLEEAQRDLESLRATNKELEKLHGTD